MTLTDTQHRVWSALRHIPQLWGSLDPGHRARLCDRAGVPVDRALSAWSAIDQAEREAIELGIYVAVTDTAVFFGVRLP